MKCVGSIHGEIWGLLPPYLLPWQPYTHTLLWRRPAPVCPTACPSVPYVPGYFCHHKKPNTPRSPANAWTLIPTWLSTNSQIQDHLPPFPSAWNPSPLEPTNYHLQSPSIFKLCSEQSVPSPSYFDENMGPSLRTWLSLQPPQVVGAFPPMSPCNPEPRRLLSVPRTFSLPSS